MGLTPALLRLDPIWDPIRNDPRFQELAAENAPLPEKSIAVLPFENLSKDEENAFFAGGMQDEILTNLAKVADLKVISRTSVMKYKSDLERNLREIAKTLGVSHVVEGSVQRAGGRVRVNVQLIDARSDAHLWAEHYDRDLPIYLPSRVKSRSESPINFAPSFRRRKKPRSRNDRPPTQWPMPSIQGQGHRRRGTIGRAGKKPEPKSGTARKGYAARSEFCPRVLRPRENAVRPLSVTGAESGLSQTHLELAKKAADAALRVRPDLGEAHLELARYYFYAGINW